MNTGMNWRDAGRGSRHDASMILSNYLQVTTLQWSPTSPRMKAFTVIWALGKSFLLFVYDYYQTTSTSTSTLTHNGVRDVFDASGVLFFFFFFLFFYSLLTIKITLFIVLNGARDASGSRALGHRWVGARLKPQVSFLLLSFILLLTNYLQVNYYGHHLSTQGCEYQGSQQWHLNGDGRARMGIREWWKVVTMKQALHEYFYLFLLCNFDTNYWRIGARDETQAPNIIFFFLFLFFLYLYIFSDTYGYYNDHNHRWPPPNERRGSAASAQGTAEGWGKDTSKRWGGSRHFSDTLEPRYVSFFINMLFSVLTNLQVF